MAGFFLNDSGLHSTCMEDDGVIDLGLSLNTLHPQVYHPSTQFVPYQSARTKAIQECDEEVEGVQSKERWAYVKVNMDGSAVGRKICILDHADYSTLAIQLEEMFGRLCISGLRLFEAESNFLLIYKDNKGIWRPVGDAPWKEFVDCVNRLRIVRKNGTPNLFWP